MKILWQEKNTTTSRYKQCRKHSILQEQYYLIKLQTDI